jgi:hypothetical protein
VASKKQRRGVHKNVTKGVTKAGRRYFIPYLRVSAGPQRNEYVHRMIAEALLRRPLKPNETVDHKDSESLNCDPANIQVLSWSDHGKVTRARDRKKEGLEGINYEVILDGAKVFRKEEEDLREPIQEMAASADTK